MRSFEFLVLVLKLVGMNDGEVLLANTVNNELKVAMQQSVDDTGLCVVLYLTRHNQWVMRRWTVSHIPPVLKKNLKKIKFSCCCTVGYWSVIAFALLV